MNMNDRTFETFPKMCHPSDLEIAFKNIRDRRLISDWLNTIKDIGEFLKSDSEEIHYESK